LVANLSDIEKNRFGALPRNTKIDKNYIETIRRPPEHTQKIKSEIDKND
jgi:hypothetical protein